MRSLFILCLRLLDALHSGCCAVEELAGTAYYRLRRWLVRQIESYW